MKFILNKTSGINGIEKVSLEKIIQTFSVPENIEITKDEFGGVYISYKNKYLDGFYIAKLRKK